MNEKSDCIKEFECWYKTLSIYTPSDLSTCNCIYITTHVRLMCDAWTARDAVAIERWSTRTSGWQLIETAPKDGTKILLYIDERIESGNWVEMSDDGPGDMGHDAGWISDSGWTFPGRSFGNPDYYIEAMAQPTHWQPRPEPPNEQG